MSLRKALFWTHFAVGILAGGVILFMALTGILLSFEPQILAWADRDVRAAPAPPAGTARLPLETLAGAAEEASPKGRLSQVTLSADPAASVTVSFGKENGALYLDPYRGVVLGGESGARAFLHTVEELHRWLGAREIGKPITGAAGLAFAFLLVSGLICWWPRKRTRGAFRAISIPNLRLKGRARDWNWHNAFGLWASPLLLLLTLTGVLISYTWASDLLFILTGNEPPPRQEQAARVQDKAPRAGKAEGPSPKPIRANLDTLFARASALQPAWATLSLSPPRKPGDPVTVTVITSTTGWRKYARSQALLDPGTAAVMKWEPYAGQNLGRKLRGLVVPVHTGRALGIPGQILAFFAACAAALLVYTGIAMAFRRCFRRVKPSAVSSP